MQRRIAFIHHCATKSGASRSLLELVLELRTMGIRELVLSPSGSALESFRSAYLNVVEIPAPSLFLNGCGAPLRGARLLTLFAQAYATRSGVLVRRALEGFTPDLVHLNERGLFHAAAICKRLGFPVIMHARNVSDRECRWAHRLSVRLMKRYVNGVIAIDGSVAHSLREFGLIDIVYNPIPRDLPAEPQLSSRIPKPGKARVLFLANLITAKGVEELLAAALLLRDHPEIRFVLAGMNSRSPEFHASFFGTICRWTGLTPDFERYVRQFVHQHGLEDRVEMRGFVENIYDLISSADIHVFPSRLNGPSRGVFEAGICGVPSIVAMRDVVKDVVIDGQNGLIIPEADPDALAQAIRRLAFDPQLRQQLGENARRQFTMQFDPRQSAQGVLAVYERILRTPSLNPQRN